MPLLQEGKGIAGSVSCDIERIRIKKTGGTRHFRSKT